MRTVSGLTYAFVVACALNGTSAQADPLSFTQIDAGRDHVCAIVSDTTLRCWGGGEYGQTGLSIRTDFNTPRRPRNAGSGYVGISAGEYSTIGLRSTGRAWLRITGTGDNSFGQLGGGPGDMRITFEPLPIGRPRDWSGVTLGVQHGCASQGIGGVRCWGANPNGEVGDGTNTDAMTAMIVGRNASRMVRVVASFLFSCGLDNRGLAWCWGYNGFGALGSGGFDGSNIPQRVAGLPRNLRDIAAGDLHACAIDQAGAAYCWGENSFGQVGDGSVGGIRPWPSMVDGIGDVSLTGIAGGGSHTCALSDSGMVYCWGNNSLGQLGNGTTESSAAPVMVQGLPDPVADAVVGLTAGYDFNCALTSQGAAYCWGDNTHGQLGDGTNTASSVAVRVSF
ncbi:MAG: hypothetical protein KDK12_02915 [Rhodobacteraceae bacterium]|nr:hypothetical protein [Paracoccaceae bacterium]